MKRFYYGLDPLCLVACAAYATNRWLVKPHTTSVFFHGTFNDLLLIPAALPWLLWLERGLRLRTHDKAPTNLEIFLHWLIWSIVCEGVAPHLFARSTGDWQDVLFYALGAFLSALWWKWSLRDTPDPRFRP